MALEREGFMRKGFFISIVLVLVLCPCLLFGLTRFVDNNWDIYQHICSTIGISLPNDLAIEYSDSHGGFHGDGTLVAVLAPRNERDAVKLKNLIQRAGWRSELPSDMYASFFGGSLILEGSRTETSGYFHDLSIDVPNVKHAYFYYKDRFLEQTGEQCPYAPYTQNFTLAMFDLDTNTLYFIEGDL